MLEDYIEKNPWVTNSELYKSGKYTDYKMETIPKIDLGFVEEGNNLELKKMIEFLDFWKLYEPYPIKIYIFIAALSKESFLDSAAIENNHLKDLIELGMGEFSIKTENLELLIYSLKYNFITNDEALILASEYIKINVIKYLVKNGATTNSHFKNNEALKLAYENGCLEIATILVKNSFFTSNHEALIQASQYGNIEAVKYLVENGADVHADDDKALIFASKNGNIEVVKYLVEYGSDIHANNDEALEQASYFGHLDVVQYLVEHGADIHANDDYALYYALQYGHTDVVTFLREKSGPGV